VATPYLVVLVGLGSVYLYAFTCIRPTVATDTVLLDYWVSTVFRYASSPLDLSVMSPVQGLGGLVFPLGVWLDPVHLLCRVCRDFVEPAVFSQFVAIVLLSGAVLALARLTGLGWLPSVLAAQTVAIAYFPPNKLVNTGQFILAPCLMTLYALSVGFLALFLLMGKASFSGNLACLCALPFTIVYAGLCDPGFAPIFFLPSVFIACGVLVGSPSRKVFLWRLLGATSTLVILLASGIPRYYHALTGYCARGWFPNELYVEVQRWDNLTPVIYKFMYRKFHHQFYYNLTIAIVMGCCGVLAAFHAKKEQKAFVAATLVYLALVVAMTLTYVYSGVRWSMPLPDYFDVGAHAAYVLAALMGLQIAWEKRASWLPGSAKPLPIRYIAHLANSRLLVQSVCVLCIPTVATGKAMTRKDRGVPRGRDYVGSQVLPNHTQERQDVTEKPRPGAVTGYLKAEVGLGPDGRFRGSVASVVGVPGGEVARHLDFSDDAPFSKSNIGSVPPYLQETFDKNLFMTGLWNLGIPTLEDYSHLITPPMHFLFSRALSRPQDFHSRNWALITRPEPKLMSALGVRFILTDRDTESDSTSLAKTVENSQGVSLRIYATLDPNLGHYTPTRVRLSENALETIALMTAGGFSFRNEVIVHDPEIASSMPSLVTAKGAALFYERGGVRVKAASSGPGLVLLPLQFSNCLKVMSVDPPASGRAPKLVRCNLLLTGVLFEGDVDMKIAHVFGPFRGIEGRLQDIRDCRALGIKETGDVRYPPDYQPLARPDWVIWRPLHAISRNPYGEP
jgi:hypothetical protein